MSKIKNTSPSWKENNPLSLKDFIESVQKLFIDEFLIIKICQYQELDKFLLIEKMMDSAKKNLVVGNEIEAVRLCSAAVNLLKRIEIKHSLKFF